MPIQKDQIEDSQAEGDKTQLESLVCFRLTITGNKAARFSAIGWDVTDREPQYTAWYCISRVESGGAVSCLFSGVGAIAV